jgi:hypothetical protein
MPMLLTILPIFSTPVALIRSVGPITAMLPEHIFPQHAASFP